MRIVTLTGAKNSGTDKIASLLSENSDVGYIRPYTDKNIPFGEIAELYGDYHHVAPEVLDQMIEDEEVLSINYVNGTRYVFFKFQLEYDYNILIADDYTVVNIKTNYDDVYSVMVHSKDEKPSNRVGVYLYEHEFDEVFNYDTDDIDSLEWRIGFEFD